MNCPKCKTVQADDRSDCSACGIIFQKFLENQAAVLSVKFEHEVVGKTRRAPTTLIVVGVIVLVAVVGLFRFGSDTKAGKAARAVAAVVTLNSSAKAAYDQAYAAVRVQDYLAAEKLFSEAIREQGDFLEALYNRGAARSRLAIDLMRNRDERGSLRMYKNAVDDKKRAKELMDQGAWLVYLTDREQSIVKRDVEAALADADEVLADERSLVEALKLWAMR